LPRLSESRIHIKGKQLKPARHRKVKAKARRPARKPAARASKPARHARTSGRSRSKAKPPRPTRSRTAVSRSRASSPARSAHGAAVVARRVPIPSPLPTKHVAPVFGEAGVLLAITYSIREGRRGEFFDLMRELKPLLHTIGGGDVAIYEDRSRPNYLMEVFRFKDEVEFTAFDDKFHKDRKIAAIYALLDDIVEAEKSDFKIFERRL
jgi:hypothetical protein